MEFDTCSFRTDLDLERRHHTSHTSYDESEQKRFRHMKRPSLCSQNISKYESFSCISSCWSKYCCGFACIWAFQGTNACTKAWANWLLTSCFMTSVSTYKGGNELGGITKTCSNKQVDVIDQKSFLQWTSLSTVIKRQDTTRPPTLLCPVPWECVQSFQQKPQRFHEVSRSRNGPKRRMQAYNNKVHLLLEQFPCT